MQVTGFFMSKEVEQTDLDQKYFLIQKNIGSNWVDKGKYKTQEEARQVLEKSIETDISKNDKFIYRLLKIEELVLYRSKEKKPDDMLDIF